MQTSTCEIVPERNRPRRREALVQLVTWAHFCQSSIISWSTNQAVVLSRYLCVDVGEVGHLGGCGDPIGHLHNLEYDM